MDLRGNLIIALVTGTIGIGGVLAGAFLNRTITNIEVAKNCREEFEFIVTQDSTDGIDESFFSCPAALRSLSDRRSAEIGSDRFSKDEHFLAIPGSMNEKLILFQLSACETSRCEEIEEKLGALLERRTFISGELSNLYKELKEKIQQRDKTQLGLDGTIPGCGPICRTLEVEVAQIGLIIAKGEEELDEINENIQPILSEALENLAP